MIVNTKRIEETATTALKTTFLRCKFIDAYVDSNDKTPSWDGTIFVYDNGEQKKEHMLGTVPIQVKGTTKKIVSEEASFSCSVVDLKNYYRDGGCMFFLVSVDPSTQWYKIYYTSLLIFDLDAILKKAKNQKTYTIKLKSFPGESEAEIANIFIDFVKNKPKQMSFIGKEIPSVETLEQNGTVIESLSFGTSGVGIKKGEIEKMQERFSLSSIEDDAKRIYIIHLIKVIITKYIYTLCFSCFIYCKLYRCDLPVSCTW